MKAFKVYPFVLAAGGSQVILADASYVRVLNSTGNVALSLDDIGPFGPIAAGQGFNLAANPQGQASFRRVLITDLSGSANAGNLIVADSSFVDQTLAGTVSVIDGEKARTLAGGMFSGGPSAGATAGQFSYAQLWNPAGTGKNLIVIQSAGSTPVATPISWVITNTAAATDQSAANLSNKKVGGASGVGQVRIGSTPVLPTVGFLRTSYAAANVEIPWAIKGSIVIPPNSGIGVINNIANTQVAANFEWFEENVT